MKNIQNLIVTMSIKSNARGRLNLRDIYCEANRFNHQYWTNKSSEDLLFSRNLHSDFIHSRNSTLASSYLGNVQGYRRSNTSVTQSTDVTTSHPSLSRRRIKHRKFNPLKLLSKEWEIPELPRLPLIHTSYNQLDDSTIYNKRQYEHNDILYRAASPLPPLENCRYYTELGPDPHGLQEKQITMKHHLKTSDWRRFEKDRAIIPTVYPDFFESSSRKRSYIKDMYFNSPDEQNYNLECFGKHNKSVGRCQYCDVIGNKYCSFCIEFKNRNFAWGYENNFVPIPKDVRANVVKMSTEGPFPTMILDDEIEEAN